MLRWIANVIRVQEKREFRGDVIVLFAIFVATMRVCLEVVFTGNRANPMLKELIINVSFYFLCFFMYGIPVRLLAPGPWQKRVNVVLVGLFMGMFPPVIDAMVYGWGEAVEGYNGFGYAYVFDFPSGWKWGLMSASDRSAPVGEGTALWLAVFFTTLYLWVKTASPWRTLVGAALAYVSCMFVGGILPTLVAYLMSTHFSEMYVGSGFVIGQTVVAWMVYSTVYRPRLLALILRRLVHGAPLAAVALVGYAWIKPFDLAIVPLVALIFLSSAMTLVQNDYWDGIDEGKEDRIVERYDVSIVQFAWGLVTVSLVMSNSHAALPLIAYGVVSYLYNSPAYRGKKFFPANIKMEGLAGGAAFMIGVFMASMPVLTAGANRPLQDSRMTIWMKSKPFPWEYGFDVVIAAFLAFGGWSILASLKDEKDLEMDTRTGSLNLFTILAKRGVEPERVAHRLRVASLACMLIAAWAPFLIGRMAIPYALVMSVFAVFAVLWRSADKQIEFRRTLTIIAAHLLTLAWGISAGHSA